MVFGISFVRHLLAHPVSTACTDCVSEQSGVKPNLWEELTEQIDLNHREYLPTPRYLRNSSQLAFSEEVHFTEDTTRADLMQLTSKNPR